MTPEEWHARVEAAAQRWETRMNEITPGEFQALVTSRGIRPVTFTRMMRWQRARDRMISRVRDLMRALA